MSAMQAKDDYFEVPSRNLTLYLSFHSLRVDPLKYLFLVLSRPTGFSTANTTFFEPGCL